MQTAGQDVGIFVLYCKHDKPETHSAERLAMTTLQQLVQIKAGWISPDPEEVLYEHHTHDTKPDLNGILKVINARLSTFSATFMVLDGLDEITQEAAREGIISFLKILSGDLRITFTSRPIEMIEKIFLPVGSDLDNDDIGSLGGQERDRYY